MKWSGVAYYAVFMAVLTLLVMEGVSPWNNRLPECARCGLDVHLHEGLVACGQLSHRGLACAPISSDFGGGFDQAAWAKNVVVAG